jgi:hypothetical protein
MPTQLRKYEAAQLAPKRAIRELFRGSFIEPSQGPRRDPADGADPRYSARAVARDRTLGDTQHSETQLGGTLASHRAYPALGSEGFLRITERNTQLEAALSAQSALIEEAQAEIINYLSGQIGSPEFIDRIISLFDGPQQREALRIAREALGEDFGNNA